MLHVAARPTASHKYDELRLDDDCDEYTFVRISDDEVEYARINAVDASDCSDTSLLLGYGYPLGKALLSCDFAVKRLDLDPRLFFPWDQEINFEKAAPMLEFLRSSSSLQVLNLDYAEFSDEREQMLEKTIEENENFNPSVMSLSGQMLAATSDNCSVTTIMAMIRLPPDGLVDFLTTSKWVTRLELGWWTLTVFRDDPSTHARLLEAFAANQSIAFLHMYCDPTTGPLVEQILRRLDSIQSSIRVRIACGPESLVHLTSSQRVLDTLEFQWQTINDDNVQLLIDGLSSTKSITSLWLDSCEFTESATRHFVDFLKTKANRNGNPLRELRLLIEEVKGEQPFHFPDAQFEVVVPEILGASKLQSFELNSIHHFNPELFFKHMAKHAATMELQCLRLERHRPFRHNAYLARYLAKTCTLREIHLHCGDEVLLGLERSVRRNGSLRKVSLRLGRERDSDSDREDSLLQAYCKRNEKLPSFLALPVQPNYSVDPLESASFKLPLLEVALQAPRTAPNNLLIGLLSLSDHCPISDKIRDRST